MSKTVAHPPGDRDESAEIVRLTQVMIAEGARVSAAFAVAHGLHPTDVEALTRLLLAEERGQAMTPGRLAVELGLTSGAVTFLVDRLEGAGHLSRESDPQDRRRVLLTYSARGRALAERFFGPIGPQGADLAAGFTADERDVVRRFLTAASDDLAERRRALQAPENPPS